MIFLINGPFYPYKIEAENQKEALIKCIDYEQTIYDSYAACGYDDFGEWYEDYFPVDNDFCVITEDEFNNYDEYADLVNYDFSKLKYGCNYFCKMIKNKH